MKHHLYIALAIFLLLNPPTMARAEQQTPTTAPKFFALIPDLPLMNDMVELEDQSLIFDKADGRIVESQTILENGTIKEARDFYATALPQFGWTPLGHDSYRRGNEDIIFHYEQDNATLLLNLVMKSTR